MADEEAPPSTPAPTTTTTTTTTDDGDLGPPYLTVTYSSVWTPAARSAVEEVVNTQMATLDAPPKAGGDSTNTVDYYPSLCKDRTGKVTASPAVPLYTSPAANSQAIACFNCGGPHLLSKCSKPRDDARIRESRAAARSAAGAGADLKKGRYHDGEGGPAANLRPGLFSPELLDALGMKSASDQPPFLAAMQLCGFPSAHMEPLEASPLKMIDGEEDQEEEGAAEGEEGNGEAQDGKKDAATDGEETKDTDGGDGVGASAGADADGGGAVASVQPRVADSSFLPWLPVCTCGRKLNAKLPGISAPAPTGGAKPWLSLCPADGCIRCFYAEEMKKQNEA